MREKRLICRVAFVVTLVLILLLFSTITTFATTGDTDFSPGKNAGEWLLSQLKWVAFIIIAIVCVKFLLKKSWTEFVIFLLLGGLVLAVIIEPEIISKIGEKIIEILDLK